MNNNADILFNIIIIIIEEKPTLILEVKITVSQIRAHTI